jgi:hypothetical protein
MKLEDIERYGKSARGKRELIRHLDDLRLTPRQMILAKCYECTNGYVDGKVDCLIRSCPLYSLMPFRKGAVYALAGHVEGLRGKEKLKVGVR